MQVAVKVTRCAVYVGGRYRKLRRDISNSPWIPGKCVTSVQEELERVVLPGMRSDLCKFMSAGAHTESFLHGLCLSRRSVGRRAHDACVAIQPCKPVLYGCRARSDGLLMAACSSTQGGPCTALNTTVTIAYRTQLGAT